MALSDNFPQMTLFFGTPCIYTLFTCPRYYTHLFSNIFKVFMVCSLQRRVGPDRNRITQLSMTFRFMNLLLTLYSSSRLTPLLTGHHQFPPTWCSAIVFWNINNMKFILSKHKSSFVIFSVFLTFHSSLTLADYLIETEKF